MCPFVFSDRFERRLNEGVGINRQTHVGTNKPLMIAVPAVVYLPIQRNMDELGIGGPGALALQHHVRDVDPVETENRVGPCQQIPVALGQEEVGRSAMQRMIGRE